MKYLIVSIDAKAQQRYTVAEQGEGGQALYVGSDFNLLIEALQMANADEQFSADK